MWRLSLICLILVTTGCSTTEKTLTQSSLAGAGAGVGYAVSNKNAWGAVAGGAIGSGIAELAEKKVEKRLQEAYRSGYEDGMRQAVKQQFQLAQNMQKGSQTEETEVVPVHIPEQEIDGKILEERTEYVRVLR